MFKNLVIRTSGQWWKWRLGQGLQLVGWLLMILQGAFHYLSKDNTSLQVILTLIGTMLVLTGMIFLWISIKCPFCKTRWLWLEASKRDIFNFKKWGPSMPNYEICPECKNTGIIKKATHEI